jgi:hypothetical protein
MESVIAFSKSQQQWVRLKNMGANLYSIFQDATRPLTVPQSSFGHFSRLYQLLKMIQPLGPK